MKNFPSVQPLSSLRLCGEFFLFLLLLISSLQLFGFDVDLEGLAQEKIVLSSKKLEFPDFPGAFNPSIVKVRKGYVLVFRHCPDPFWDPWTNVMVAVHLNSSFEPVSKPEILYTGLTTPCIKSQSEDPRVFSYQDKLYLIYNDNIDVSRPWYRDRRDMFISELKLQEGHFSLFKPVKLYYEKRYGAQLWQKNWVPFVWNQQLLLGYMMNPHEIIYPNLDDGVCFPCYETQAQIPWRLGVPRGSSIPQLVDGEYLAFFHAGHQIETVVSQKMTLWHYFMGAYTFSPNPPFQITKMAANPIVGEGFYTHSSHALHYLDKKVIMPGGFVVEGSHIHVVYGRDDCEMWIATLDKEALMKSLVPVQAK